MEFIASKRIPVLHVGNAANPDEVEFIMPSGILRWTLLIVPINKTASTPVGPTANVQYWVPDTYGPDGPPDGNSDLSGYFTTNPATSATTMVNQANVITREDAVSKIMVQLSIASGNAPDQGAIVILNGTRTIT